MSSGSEQSYDTVVVGAGVLGCAVAARLAAHGERIALIDRRAVASGCSGYAGAIASPLARNPRLRSMSSVSHDWYSEYRQSRPDVPIRTIPVMFIAKAGVVQRLQGWCREPLHEDAGHVLPAWLADLTDHRVLSGPPALHAQLRELCEQWSTEPGVDVYECAPATGWFGAPGRWRVNLADGRQLTGANLVLARGAWSAQEDLPTGTVARTKRIVSYTLDLPATSADPVVYLVDHDAFLLPRPERRQWWLSITADGWGAPPGENVAPTAADLAVARDVLTQFAPRALESLRGGSVHYDSYAADNGPEVSTVEGRPVVVFGGSGSGFHYAPFVAGLVADHVLGAAR